MTLQEAFDAGFDEVKAYVDRSFASFEARLVALEAREPLKGEKGDKGDPGRDGAPGMAGERGDPGERGEKGDPGRDGVDGENGKDADPDLIERMVSEAVAAIPAPKDGADGKSVNLDDVRQTIDEVVAKAVSELPPPEKGEKGDKGDPGRDGEDADMDELIQLTGARIEELVGNAVKAIPLPQDGKDGASGVGVASAVLDRDGCLILTLSDGGVKNLGRVVGRDGEPGLAGKDGEHGLGFDDLSIDYDGERTITLRFARGETATESAIKMPITIYRGVYSEGKEYERGDEVTFGGSQWIAREDTTAKPETSKAWQLACKRGRDGKDGIIRNQGPPKPVKS